MLLNIFMRKRFKIKKASCGLCKPQKRGISNRWNNKELIKLNEWEEVKNKVEPC